MKVMITGCQDAEPARVAWSLCTTMALCLLVVMLLHGLIRDKADGRVEESPIKRVFQDSMSPDLPDFIGLRDVQARKRHFFAFLRPIVESENERIRNSRNELLRLVEGMRRGGRFLTEEEAWLKDLFREFRVDTLLIGTEEGWARLWPRVDIVPIDLVLVQAATESGWGTSRFAREGNNLFGQWQFGGGGGMVPVRRSADATHSVARFASVRASVRGYLRNLNTNPAYRSLRVLRQEQREAGTFPDSEELADGLLAYSQRGEAYVAEIRAMLRINTRLLHSSD